MKTMKTQFINFLKDNVNNTKRAGECTTCTKAIENAMAQIKAIEAKQFTPEFKNAKTNPASENAVKLTLTPLVNASGWIESWHISCDGK